MTIKKLLFCSLHTLYPFAAGGGRISRHTLLSALHQKGIEVQAIGVAPSECQKEIFLPYSVVHVSEDKVIEYLKNQIKKFKPDIILSQAGGWDTVAEVARNCDIPFILHVNGQDVALEAARIILDNNIPVIVNCQFLQSLYKEAYGFTAVVFHPCIFPEQYKCVPTTPDYITLINPVYPKGVEVFLEIAGRMPEEKFLCVECWGTSADIISQIKKYPNIEHWDYQSDIRKVYERTKILLVPSLTEEAFGRVIVEAHVNGIPVIASERGGIEEALGEGGLLIPYDKVTDIETWIKAIRALDNLEERQELSKKAIENAKRFDVYQNIDIYIEILENLQKESLSKIK